MALFRFILDGNILADEPEGWQDIISELKRDKEIRGQVLLMDLTLKFKGGTDGYIHLKPLIDCQGFCAFSTMEIEEDCNQDGNWVSIFEGLIFYTEVKENLFACMLECKLTDNSFFAKINNNKNIEAFINVARSKNDEAIFAVFAGIPTRFFDPNAALATYGGTVDCWRVFDCFKFIIAYMTDGEIAFISDYFNTGLGKGLRITIGEQIRLQTGGSTKQPFFSFQKLFEQVNKKYNISFSFEIIAGVKTMRIEPASYFFKTGTSTTLNNVKGIIKSVNTSELYSRLKIGSSDTIDYLAGQTDFPNQISFAGFKEESYTMTGKCNIDNTLDLVSDWIIDSNVIQDVYVNGNTGFDDNIFFIITGTPGLDDAIKFDVFNNGPPYFYNGDLRNSAVALRWLGAIPNSIALYLGPPVNGAFMASNTHILAGMANTVTPLTFEPLAFDDDFLPPNFDTSGNYNNISFRFTAPAQGLFTFACDFKSNFRNIYHFFAPVIIKASFKLFDSLNTLIEEDIFFTDTFQVDHIIIQKTIIGSFLLAMNLGDYVYVKYEISTALAPPHLPPIIAVGIPVGGNFQCTSTLTAGGIFQTYSPEDFKAYQYQFDYPLTFAQYRAIIADPLKLIAFNDGINSYDGWIENMKYKHKEGTASFVLTTQLPKTICP